MATADSRISIVVLTRNRRDEVCRTLRNLLALPLRAAIIVVDNGSEDDSAATIMRDFPQVTLLRAGANLGAAGRNLGVARVTTPYVAFCDDDTWWAPDALARAADILDLNPAIAVLNARVLVGPEGRTDPACAAMARSPLPGVAGVGPGLVGFMAGACVLRTAAFRRAGGYWPLFFIGGEEALLALDIRAAGGRIVYAAHVCTHHWPSSRRNAPLRRRLLARNALWTAWLRLPARLAWRRSRAVLQSLPGWRERGRACLDAAAQWRLIQRHRRVVPPALCAELRQVWRADAGP
ncbi:glycosyltransferase family 2 protein [Achromobacter ruhlandii]|uniref:Glycosyltransferase 2-like domain-containing protein n=1 Tax=Achromobacter ruhlandii TaxID=72557 RepID=A0ABM8M1L8_9BURK|nr:glycosyltransferase [Achromobacter ruhlandii]AKP90566.1 Glycosyl transferase, family 2 [Achromobacter xylosoxidans]AOU93805.1 glycosyl transferase [Achromobacter ruhlandii]MCZ8432935.1 glycosyltransferase [Achromobacter ruhlandii]MDC6090747.1 glycosyltransferase [Achromobacter ruhlandii]MDC6152089.1 glycosyltransferase [Achromobacter ruhlandii]